MHVLKINSQFIHLIIKPIHKRQPHISTQSAIISRMFISTHTLRLVGILSCLTYRHVIADDSSTDDGDVDICLEKNNFAASIDEGDW